MARKGPQYETRMSPKNYLTIEERKTIETMLKEGFPVRVISDTLKRNIGTIDYEIRRAGGQLSYDAKEAQRIFLRNMGRRRKRVFPKLEGRLEEIKQLLESGKGIGSIAWKIGTNPNSVFNFLEFHGLVKKQPDFFEKAQVEEPPQQENNTNLLERIEILEMQIEILTDKIRELSNARN